MGRKSKITPAVIEKILQLLREGQSLRRICKENPDVPARENIFDYLDKDEDFATRYARAKEIGSHALVEDSIDIADAAKDRTAVEKARVQIQARQWAASKLHPKKYGDKQTVEMEGGLNLTLNISQMDESESENKTE